MNGYHITLDTMLIPDEWLSHYVGYHVNLYSMIRTGYVTLCAMLMVVTPDIDL